MTEPSPAPAAPSGTGNLSAKAAVTSPAPPQPGASGLTADEEAQLASLVAKQHAAAGDVPTVRLRVEGDHSEVTFGGITVGRDYTVVPASMASAITENATAAGVTVTQDQES